jgi:hypothetical protein
MPHNIIHCGALFPPSFGPARTRCGLNLPFDASHFGILGVDPPRNSKQCKRCKKALKTSYWYRQSRKKP